MNKLMAQSFGANVARVIGAVQPIVLQPSHALGIVTAHVDKASRDQTTRCAPQTRTHLVSSSISACYISHMLTKCPSSRGCPTAAPDAAAQQKRGQQHAWQFATAGGSRRKTRPRRSARAGRRWPSWRVVAACVPLRAPCVSHQLARVACPGGRLLPALVTSPVSTLDGVSAERCVSRLAGTSLQYLAVKDSINRRRHHNNHVTSAACHSRRACLGSGV